jgi:hypothetical protein
MWFVPPLRGGESQLVRFPRVSPWAIFVFSLREKPDLLPAKTIMQLRRLYFFFENVV